MDCKDRSCNFYHTGQLGHEVLNYNFKTGWRLSRDRRLEEEVRYFIIGTNHRQLT